MTSASPAPSAARLTDRLVVVTAGTQGIGLAIARRCIREGAQVIVTTHRQDSADAAIEILGPRARAVVCDAADVDAMSVLEEAIKETGRPLDALVANAGRDIDSTLIVDTTPEEFDMVVDLNVRGTFFTVSRLLPLMRDGGAIVLTGSIAGSNGGPGHAVYNLSKAAVRSLARTITSELRDRRIRANVVSPGPTATDGFTQFTGGSQEVEQAVVDMIPVGRIGTPDELAAVAAFLLSDESAYIAGAELVADGGMSQI